MSRIKCPESVKLFVGLISNDIALINNIERVLVKRFGPVDFESNIFDFNCTAYYNEEFGENLKRKFLSFRKLINIERAAAIKILTNKLEKKFSLDGKRRINIDPGYLSLSKLVLLTTKDFSHRIYLGRGIYAEATLRYTNKTFQPFEWSYPDYRSDDYVGFFNKVREGYARQSRCPKC